ncbi:MAG: PD-(D/E)XK nuclease family protein [Pseudomonadota bacterium]
MANNILTISANSDFSLNLASWILNKYGKEPLSLAKLLILLPSRRSCLALREAFLRLSYGKPLLLPRMQPIGDIDDNLLLAESKIIPSDIPDPAFTQKRLFILARLIQAYNNSRLDHALMLASELANLIDELEREQADLEILPQIVPDNFAEHWQITLEFMKIITLQLPVILAEQGLISPTIRRNKILGDIAEKWQANPPNYPVIIAGTTGSIKATAQLIKTVSDMENGFVILPALDNLADAEYQAHITETHPQFGMFELLKQLKISPDDVVNIVSDNESERLKLLREIMRPAEVSEQWQKINIDMEKALQGLKAINCSNIQEEAKVAALILRETLETSGKTAALVTQDRTLARIVSGIMKRFGVTIDDSAGIPLSETPIGIFLRLVAEAASDENNLIKRLALLKNPFTNLGIPRISLLSNVREYEHEHRKYKNFSNKNLPQDIEIYNEILQEFTKKFKDNSSITDLFSAHIKCAEKLAGNDLWRGHESKQVAEFLSLLISSGIGDIKIKHNGSLAEVYPQIFTLLLKREIFRPDYGTHPRLKILSPIEARMQSFDRIIIGGLNEGSFPESIESNAWLNHAMRKKVGLSDYQEMIGKSAHDFFMLANAKEVFLTRSQKIDGSPTIPSRWLLKLDVLLNKTNNRQKISDKKYLYLAQKIDYANGDKKIVSPAPKPPIYARPKTLYVSKIEKLLRNPFEIYASEILKLRPLEDIIQIPDASDFGNAVHKALENFTLNYPNALPENSLDILIEAGTDALKPIMQNELLKVLWGIRFRKIAEFIIENEAERRIYITEIMAEVTESLQLGDFTLKGRADRIELRKDGTICVIDYKTGSLPKKSDINSGLSSQLVLLGLIMNEKLQKEIGALEYWGLSGGGREAGKVKPLENINELIASAKQGLINLIHQYNNHDFPYLAVPIAERASKYNDYEHLARIAEWSV